MRFQAKSLLFQHNYTSRNKDWQMSAWTMSAYGLDILEGSLKYNTLRGHLFRGSPL